MGTEVHLIRSSGTWEGLYEVIIFPMYAINPPGGIGDPARDPITALLLFDDTSPEMIAGAARMHEGWVEGSELIPIVFMRAATATDPAGTTACQWSLEYKWYNDADPLPALYTTIAKTCVLPAHIGVLPVNKEYMFPTISGIGRISNSMIEWRLTRDAANELDTYTDDCVLIGFYFKYRKARLGQTT